MSLSKHERQAWEEIERVLADDLPYTHTDLDTTMVEQLTEDFLPAAVGRTLILITVLTVGVWLLIIGALAQLLPMAVGSLIIICVAVDRLHRPGNPDDEQPTTP
ncbi:DUF3040 domain-containing protein [Arthrobacter sp. TmT3-37]